MRLTPTHLLILCLAAIASPASATTMLLGTSTQNVSFKGIGGTPTGAGQSTVTWGSCAFDGTNTNCTLSGPFTGIGPGGTFALVFTYPGNGPSPLTAISSVPGGDQIFFSATAGSFLMTITETNGTKIVFYDSNRFNFQFSNPTCTGITTCRVGLAGLTANATISGPVTGSYDATPYVSAGGVITAGQFGSFPAMAPGSWIEIYGTNLATTPSRTWAGADFNGNTAPNALAGTTVTIGGQQAFLDYVSPGQVNAQVPSGINPGQQLLSVTTAGGTSDAMQVTVNPVEPGMLAPLGFKLQAGQYAAAVFSDNVTFAIPPGAIAGIRSQRARPGDTLIFYGVGFGPVTPNIPSGQIVQGQNTVQGSFQASFGGVAAKVNYSGLAGGFLGLYQFNVVVPNVPSSDAVPFTFTVGSTGSAQTLLVAVQN